MSRERTELWGIFEGVDQPGYVARVSVAVMGEHSGQVRGTDTQLTGATLEAVREQLPVGVERVPLEDEQLVEGMIELWMRTISPKNRRLNAFVDGSKSNTRIIRPAAAAASANYCAGKSTATA